MECCWPICWVEDPCCRPVRTSLMKLTHNFWLFEIIKIESCDGSRLSKKRIHLERESTIWLAEQMASNCWKTDRDLGFWRRGRQVRDGLGMKRLAGGGRDSAQRSGAIGWVQAWPLIRPVKLKGFYLWPYGLTLCPPSLPSSPWRPDKSHGSVLDPLASHQLSALSFTQK